MRAVGLGVLVGTLVVTLAISCGSNEPGDSDGSDTGGTDTGGGSSSDGSGASQGEDGGGGDSSSGGDASDGEGGDRPNSGGASSDSGGTANASGGMVGSGGSGEPSTEGCTLVWKSGFETGFPGEWLDYDNGTYSEDGNTPAGEAAGWTIIEQGDGPILAGEHAYKGWAESESGESHRPYPVLHDEITTPLINTFYTYLEADYSQVGSDWIHFGTWGKEVQGSGAWAVHTMSIVNGLLEFAHTSPSSGEYIGPQPRTQFPLGQWVRFTVYIHYEGSTGFVQAWQDGEPMLRADVSPLLEELPGAELTRAHWGLYGPGSLTDVAQYNDEIGIWTLDGPLEDLDAEPDCYLGD